MNDVNPLKQFFRHANLYLRLPTLGRWYTQDEVNLSPEKELAVYGLTAIDEILLNTPDAMLNGQALEKVIRNCAPDVKNTQKLLVPDIEALFLAIKIATTNGKHEYTRYCPKCNHENNFEVNCQHLLDTMSYVDDSDTQVNINDELIVYIKPYSFSMRQQFVMQQFEEERTLKAVDEANTELNEIQKARLLAESIEKLSRTTFNLVAQSITKVVIISQNVTVTDSKHIAEWLISINKSQADNIIKAVDQLNAVGIQRKVPAQCEACGHAWQEELNFDPVSFFGRR